MDKRKSESIVVIKKVISVIIILIICDNFSYVIVRCREDHKNLLVFFEGQNIVPKLFDIMFECMFGYYV